MSDRIPMIVCQGFQATFNRPIAATLWLVSVSPIEKDDDNMTLTKIAAAEKVATITHTEAELMYVVPFSAGLPVSVELEPRKYKSGVKVDIPTPDEDAPPTDNPPGGDSPA